MSATTLFIDTNKLPRLRTSQGEVTEILNHELVGAKNVLGSLRWLKAGETFTAEAVDTHQLIYLMEGKGSIRLEGKDYEASRGAGIYLGPLETASIEASTSVKLFHVMVPRIPE